MKDIEVKILKSNEAGPYLDQIIKLQTSNFEQFPYLYSSSKEGDLYYISPYLKSSNSTFMLLLYQKELVGLSLSIPLPESFQDIKELFTENKLDINQYLYVGTITLSEKIRNWYLVYDVMKTHYKTATNLGLSYLTALTVDRPDDHPMRPLNYRSPDKLWQRFGWHKYSSLKLQSNWIQTDTNQEESNTLSIWIHPLNKEAPKLLA